MPKNNPENKTETKSVFEKVTAATGSYASITIHTVIFAVFLLAPVFGWMERDDALLILTTIVSLEAIYLALFIQMSVNRNTESLESVEEDIQEIQEDVEDISEEVEDLGEDLEEIQESQEKIEKDIDEIHEHVEDISEDVEELGEDVEELEEDTDEEKKRKEEQKVRLEKIESTLEMLLKEIGNLKK
jgi:uncharacterized protein YoxC